MYVQLFVAARGISRMQIDFDPGEPFSPFNQLMGVLPEASCHCLPEPLR